jgi:hypothetical protein
MLTEQLPSDLLFVWLMFGRACRVTGTSSIVRSAAGAVCPQGDTQNVILHHRREADLWQAARGPAAAHSGVPQRATWSDAGRWSV